jgi:HD-like signal output (HDOD) protein
MTANEFFKNLTLPMMPEVAHDLIRSLNEEDVPLTHLREAIGRDPALAVQLLRLANSAHYGNRHKVGTIEEAIARVGVNQVRALALAAFFNDAFPVAPGAGPPGLLARQPDLRWSEPVAGQRHRVG